MFGLQKALVFSTLLLSTFASPTHHHDSEITNWEKFSALLDTVDEISLHRVLHALSPKFKDGVFSKDRSAIEHVHSENPIMASKLVHIAKRQGSNTTVTTSPSTSATSSTPEQSSSASSASSSIASSVSSALSSALSSEITASTVPPPTTVLVAPTSPQSATPIATQSNAVVYSTYGGGVVTLTSSAVGVSFSPSTSTHLYYSTAQNGEVQTSTAVVVVNAPITQTAARTGAAGAATTTGSAGLQNGAVQMAAGGFLAACAGVAAMMVYV